MAGTGILQMTEGPREGRFRLEKEACLLGRDPRADIAVPEDKRISRRHCMIGRGEDGGYYVEDLGSRNGTFVNGERIGGRTAIEHGDTIRVGRCVFTFLDEERLASGTKFCTVCGGSISSRELRDGLAEPGPGGGYVCADCARGDTFAGRAFLNYTILCRIAQGGMGVVYKARHMLMGTVVALKLIREGKQGDERAVKRFLREIRMGAAVKHPNIIEFLDAGEHEGMKYLVMEYCDGISLDRKVRRDGVLGLEEFADVAFQALDAVCAIHDAGLVHRDIKPSNFLVTRDNTVKLIDFGLAKSMDPETRSILTASGMIVGTPHYMPPEQIQEARVPDVRGDIYSLGATFYVLVCGEPPVQGKTAVEYVKNLTAHSIVPPHEKNPDVPEEIGRWIMKALALDPDERYRSAHEFAATLEDICGAE